MDKIPSECGVETLTLEALAESRADLRAFMAGKRWAMRFLSDVARISFPTAMYLMVVLG